MRWLVAVTLAACGGTPHPSAPRSELQLVPLSSATRTRIAVFGVEPVLGAGGGVDQRQLVQRIDTQIHELVAQRDDIVVVSPPHTFEDEMVRHSCSGLDAVCLAAISADVGAEFIVFGLLDRSGAVALRLYGARANALGGATTLRDGDITRGAIDKVIDGYLEQCESQLVLHGGVLADGSVAIDERRAERVRGNHLAIDALPAGHHHIVIAPHAGEPLAVDVDLPCDGAEYHVMRAP